MQPKIAAVDKEVREEMGEVREARKEIGEVRKEVNITSKNHEEVCKKLLDVAWDTWYKVSKTLWKWKRDWLFSIDFDPEGCRYIMNNKIEWTNTNTEYVVFEQLGIDPKTIEKYWYLWRPNRFGYIDGFGFDIKEDNYNKVVNDIVDIFMKRFDEILY